MQPQHEGLIEMTLPRRPSTTPCSICGKPAPLVDNLDIDPVCPACIALNADETPHTLAGVDIPTLMPHPREGVCPGFNVSECGNPILAGDLCPDCTTARLNHYF